MKKLIRTLSLLTVLCTLTACGGETLAPLGAPQAGETVQEPVETPVENVLHKVSVTESIRPFVTASEDGPVTEYAIVVSDHDMNKEAASFLVKHIAAATGATLEILAQEDVVYSDAGKFIYLNCADHFAAAGLTMPAEDMGQRGYYIKSVEDAVFIATKVPSGAQLGAIAFLRHVLGYDAVAADTAVYEKAGDTLPELDITERPDYDFYIASNKLDSATTYAMGYQEQTEVFIRVTSELDKNGMYHNSLDYLPYEQFAKEHRAWYSDVVYGTNGERELCYTAHGDQEELAAMVDTIAQRMILEAGNNPDLATVCLTIEDHNTVCSCDACTASANAYGGSNSAAVIQLLNRVNEKVQASLQADADAAGTDKRELNILFFAYHKMLKAPARKNAQGVWEPIDETVVCAKEVGVYYAPIEAYYIYPFSHANNTDHYENTKAWAACSERIYMWTYCTNFGHYLFPYNTFDSMVENYRFFRSYGATFMFNQGQHNVSSVSHFSAFKEYLTSKALFDLSVNQKDVTDRFFAAYFRDAQAPMRQYYDELQAHLGYLSQTYPVQLNGYIREEIASLQYWPKETLQRWMGYIDEAYAAIEQYKDTDPALYESLYDHILQESIFPRYALLELHFGSYHAEELNTLRRQFKSDCEKLGVNNISEWVPISTVFSRWGIL